MSSLVTNLNSSTAQEIVNWPTGSRLYSADTTQLDFAVGKFVQTRHTKLRLSPKIVANCEHTADAT